MFQPDGTWNVRARPTTEISAAMADWQGSESKKVRNFLTDSRSVVFLDRRPRRLAAVQPDKVLRQAGLRRWWLRHRPSQPEELAQTPQAHLPALLHAKIRDGELPVAEQAASDRVAHVLRTTVRASSAVEGIHRVRRMQQGRHRKMTHGMLDRKRRDWNCRRLQTGKRRGRSP